MRSAHEGIYGRNEVRTWTLNEGNKEERENTNHIPAKYNAKIRPRSAGTSSGPKPSIRTSMEVFMPKKPFTERGRPKIVTSSNTPFAYTSGLMSPYLFTQPLFKDWRVGFPSKIKVKKHKRRHTFLVGGTKKKRKDLINKNRNVIIIYIYIYSHSCRQQLFL